MKQSIDLIAATPPTTGRNAMQKSSRKAASASTVSLRLPKRDVAFIDWMVSTKLFDDRSEAVTFIVRSQLLRIHLDQLPKKAPRAMPEKP